MSAAAVIGAPPHDLRAEEAIIGAVLLAGAVPPDVIDSGLLPEHFYRLQHGTVYAAALELQARGAGIDSVALAAQLNGRLEAVGGHGAIDVLTAAVPNAANAGAYARIVVDAAETRRERTAHLAHLERPTANTCRALVDVLTGHRREDAPHSWAPEDLLPDFEGNREPDRPTLLRRPDGVALLYRGRAHSVSAEPESGKGWLALAGSVEALDAGGSVAYLDFEDTAASIAGRLRALGVTPDALDRFHYVRPDEPVTSGAVKALNALGPALVVIDGVTEALTIEGLGMDDNQDIAEFHKRLVKPFARAGAAVLLIDHVVKDREARGRYAIGGQHKLAGVDVAYRLDVAQPFGRGREGLVKLTVTKDRPGYVREHAQDRERIALMRLASTDGEGVTVTLDAPDAGGAAFRPTLLMARVSRAVNDTPGLSIRGLREAVSGNHEAKGLALELLVTEGYVEARREGQAIKHYPVREYQDDPTVPTVPNRAQSVPGHMCPRAQPPTGGHGAGTVIGTPTVPTALQDRAEQLADRNRDLAA